MAGIRQKLGFALYIVLVGCVILATRIYEVDLPIWHFFGGGKGLDPATLHLAGEFVESNLGTFREADGSYTVRLLAQQYLFVPQCVEVPAGVPIHFRITSADVVHMLSVSGTSDTVQAIPGRVSQAVFQFSQPAEFGAPCKEFCGPGHFAMQSHLRVLPQEQFANLQPGEKRNCSANDSASANNQPPLHIPSEVAWARETIQLAGSGNAFHGSLLARQCAHCHGPEGFSAEAAIPNLAGVDRLSTWKQLRDFRSGQRNSTVMQPIATLFSAQDAADVAAYFSMLPTFADPMDNRAFPQAIPDAAKSREAEKLIVFGDASRGIPPCEACHGPVGRVKGSPSLATQNARYLLTQLQHFSDGTRTNDINLVMRSIARKLTDEEKGSLSDYYGAGRGPSAQAAHPAL